MIATKQEFAEMIAEALRQSRRSYVPAFENATISVTGINDILVEFPKYGNILLEIHRVDDSNDRVL